MTPYLMHTQKFVRGVVTLKCCILRLSMTWSRGAATSSFAMFKLTSPKGVVVSPFIGYRCTETTKVVNECTPQPDSAENKEDPSKLTTVTNTCKDSVKVHQADHSLVKSYEVGKQCIDNVDGAATLNQLPVGCMIQVSGPPCQNFMATEKHSAEDRKDLYTAISKSSMPHPCGKDEKCEAVDQGQNSPNTSGIDKTLSNSTPSISLHIPCIPVITEHQKVHPKKNLATRGNDVINLDGNHERVSTAMDECHHGHHQAEISNQYLQRKNDVTPEEIETEDCTYDVSVLFSGKYFTFFV